MRVLICGSRTFTDERIIHTILHGIEAELDDDDLLVIIDGKAAGADAIAGAWRNDNVFVVHDRYDADWDKYGKGAGPVRNVRMLQEGKPNVVYAFINKPLAESKGTAHMVGLARKAGIPTYVIQV